MLDSFDLVGQSNLTTDLDYSKTWRSSGTLQEINDKTLQRKFSGSSADYGDFLQIGSFFDATDSLDSLEYSRIVALNSGSVLSTASNISPLVASDPGSVFSTAYNIGNLTGPKTLTEFVGYYTDPTDIYRFDLPSYSSFNLSLNGLSADADVELLDAFGTRVSISNNIGTNYEWIDGSLSVGTYYVKVSQYSSGFTNYRLGLSATPIANNTRTVLGTLDANAFTFQSGFNRTVISGNGNVDFGTGARDLLNLSSIYSSTVTFNNAANSGGGLLYNPGNGTRIFDAITLNNGSQILFEGIDRIQFADTTLNLSVTPNDPLFGKQWNLHMMGVQNAWRFNTGSNNVLVGIEDSGLAINSSGNTHTDLRTATIFPNNYRDDFSVNDPKSHGHGTAVQGVIAAISNNGSGMSGINWNSPVFNIDVGRDINDQLLSEATRNLIAEANQKGLRLIVNMSLEVPNNDLEFNQLVANNPNVLFAIAAGNNGQNGLANPAILAGQYNNVIAVGASWGTTAAIGSPVTPGQRIQYNGNDEWGSQYGTGLTLMGPSEVVSTRATRSLTGAIQFDYYPSIDSFNETRIDGFNGTSAATPNVTGVASLVWSANPNLSATQVKQILSQTAYDLGVPGYDTLYGNGFVNADAAVRRALALRYGAA